VNPCVQVIELEYAVLLSFPFGKEKKQERLVLRIC